MFSARLPTAAAALVAAAAGSVVLAGTTEAAGSAAACSGDTGVTVIVDFNELGGGITAGCDPGGAGEPASQVFTDAGFALTFVQQDPGFICRVSGKPADNPCVRTPPASAYWSLWWSDGVSGDWAYASSGVNALEVPDGGYVAFAWHQGDGTADPPDATPTAHEESEPTQDTTDNGGGDGDGDDNDDGDENGDATSDAPTTAVTTETTATTTAANESTSGAGMPDATDKSRHDEATDRTSEASESTVPGAAEITAGPPSGDLATESGDDDGGSLPTWIGLALAVLVLGAAGLVTVLRRRAG